MTKFYRALNSWPRVLLLGLLSACGGGGGGTSTPPPDTPPRFSVGGTITGLQGVVVLRDGSRQQMTLNAGSGSSFALGVRLSAGASYAVDVAKQPDGQQCTVTNGTGAATADISNIVVSCAAAQWHLGGRVQGLTGTLGLRNGDGQSLTLTSNGSFQFPKLLMHGADYAVSITDQPPGLICAVTDGLGTIAFDVTAVTVSCNGNGPPPTTVPTTPVNLTVGYSVKSYALRWSATATATHYQVFEDPDGPGPLPASRVGPDLVWPAYTVTHAVLLPGRVNAQYTIRACNAAGCSGSTAALQPDILQAVGYFKGASARIADAFGTSVAVSADGSTLAVGATGDRSSASGVDPGSLLGSASDDSSFGAGSVYVFTRNSGLWTQQAYIKSTNPRGGGDPALGTFHPEFFGTALALSSDGNTLAVGAPGFATVYLFTRGAGVWSPQTAVQGRETSTTANFGVTVSLSADGNTLAVGAAGESSSASAIGAGSVYVFSRSAGTWNRTALLEAGNAGVGASFGASVALAADGNTLAVGASGERSSAKGVEPGSLTGSPADQSAPFAGAAYVFTRIAGGWTQQAYLKASNTEASAPGGGDGFGVSIAISGDGNTLAVGATREDNKYAGAFAVPPVDNELAGQSGAVYVFTRNAGLWSQQAYVKASNTDIQHAFGGVVALSFDGATLVVGATGENSGATGIDPGALKGFQMDSSAPRSGAAYVFTRASGVWTQGAYLKAGNSRRDALFGVSASLSADGNTLALGASGDSSRAIGINGDQADTSTTGAGAVFVY